MNKTKLVLTVSVFIMIVTLVNIPPALALSTSETTILKIGVDNQPVQDVVFFEGTPAAFREGQELRIYLTPGVEYSCTPSVTVTEGDLDIEKGSVSDHGSYISIIVKSESTEPSALRISNLRLKVNRAVPDGNVVMSFNNSRNLSEVVGKVDLYSMLNRNVSKFQVGKYYYSLNSNDRTMDVAPYVKNGRVFLPLVYICEAIGLDKSDIHWNSIEQRLTLYKGNKSIELKVGEPILLVNGSEVFMDTSPEIVEPGRVMLPARWVVEKFGGTVEWMQSTQTVNIYMEPN
ncbi:stalk domain-containing protein [Heliobacterium mobile]|nr:stalk domain-containing protein [Heliobacterium mobile]